MSGLLPEDAEAIVRLGVAPTVWHRHQLEWLLAADRSTDATIPIHLEIDTGMSRQGIAPGKDLATLLAWIKTKPKLHLEAVFTHFASAEIAGSPQTLAQRRRFEQAIAAVAEAGLRPTWLHAGNSSTIDTDVTEHNLAWLRGLASSVGAKSMVRTGIALYGYCLPIETSTAAENPSAITPVIEPALRPILTWKTRIIGLRDLQPHDTVGYNALFTAPAPMRLALLPIGYADGLRRELSAGNSNPNNTQPGGWVVIAGHRAPIVGRISMNLTTVDITPLPNVHLGDEAILLGDGITANDHARLARTIPYEILCGLRAPIRTGTDEVEPPSKSTATSWS
jgi:alanine racemase